MVYDEEADTQATSAIIDVGTLLSRELGLPTLAVLNHDDDVLCYWLFEGGELADSYNLSPDSFQEEEGTPSWQAGNAGMLCTLLRPGQDSAAVEEILRGDCFGIAMDKHDQLARALGLPSWSIGFGYRYVSRGELNDKVDVNQLVFVGGGKA